VQPERVLIRADAGDRIGHGHLARCITLADDLSKGGSETVIVLGRRSGWQRAVDSRSEGLARHRVVTIAVPDGVDTEDAEGPCWDAADQEKDAEATLEVSGLVRPDIVIVDHYRFDRSWEAPFRERGARVVVIDDLADRVHECDVLVDMGRRGSAASDYSDMLPSDAVRLLGPRYAIIDPAYAETSSVAEADGRERIVVCFGGAASVELTATAIEATDCTPLRGVSLDVIVAARPDPGSRLATCIGRRDDVTVHVSPDGLMPILQGSTLAIGAAGISMWERLSLGIPSVVVTTAQNQELGAARLAGEGLIVHLGRADDIDLLTLRAALVDLLANVEQRGRMVTEGRALVDGAGARRVAIAASRSSTLRADLRPARQSDALALLGLTNDPEVRRQSFDDHAVTLEEHLGWFGQQLDDVDRAIYVLEARGTVIGQVRFAPTPEGLELSYSLDAAVRGRGLSEHLLTKGCQAIRERGSTAPILARTRRHNAASRRALERAGFELVDGGAMVSYLYGNAPALMERSGEES